MPTRQVALLGENPSIENAAAILRPIAERAWRRPIREGELDRIVSLVRSKAKTLNEIEALNYDHRNDPNEFTNLADSPEFQTIIREHAARLPKYNAPSAPREVRTKPAK